MVGHRGRAAGRYRADGGPRRVSLDPLFPERAGRHRCIHRNDLLRREGSVIGEEEPEPRIHIFAIWGRTPLHPQGGSISVEPHQRHLLSSPFSDGRRDVTSTVPQARPYFLEPSYRWCGLSQNLGDLSGDGALVRVHSLQPAPFEPDSPRGARTTHQVQCDVRIVSDAVGQEQRGVDRAHEYVHPAASAGEVVERQLAVIDGAMADDGEATLSHAQQVGGLPQ